VSDTTDGVWDRVFGIYAPIGLGVLVLVTVLVVLFVIRYRARGEDGPAGGPTEKNPVEFVYAGILALVAAGLIWITLDANDDLQAQFDAPAAIRVEVTGARWNWRFDYPKLGFADQGTRTHIPTLTVPAGEPVDFTGTSIDVVHSFWIPDERFKRDVFPHRDTTWQMTFSGPRFLSGVGRCAEFCGLRHAEMRFNVDVLSPERFDAWSRHAKAGRK
jgi:cytochrome c oxidase subunit 2